MKMLSFCAFILVCFTSWASSQSLVELSKREKERRAKITQKKVTVIRNVDLIKKKLTPALESLPSKKIVPAKADSITNPEGEVAEPKEIDTENPDQIEGADMAQLEEKWNKSEEFVSLLSLRIRALLQGFYSTGDAQLKADIQRQMNTISLRLEKAKMDAEKAKEEYDTAKEALEKKKRSNP